MVGGDPLLRSPPHLHLTMAVVAEVSEKFITLIFNRYIEAEPVISKWFIDKDSRIVVMSWPQNELDAKTCERLGSAASDGWIYWIQVTPRFDPDPKKYVYVPSSIISLESAEEAAEVSKILNDLRG